ncbi:MAG: NUDIX domain-containing protein [Cryomorphaceae bacterium]|nr:NUDIX domain-containing protein [Cryomorphaceae bacterium]
MAVLVRVYGIIENDQKEILLSSEFFRDKYFTKFPGGGLKQGESTRECLVREIQEEIGQNCRVNKHFYTTDFFIKSAFNPEDQVISIYYYAQLNNWEMVQAVDISERVRSENQQFHWVKKNLLSEALVNFPADKFVLRLLQHTL